MSVHRPLNVMYRENVPLLISRGTAGRRRSLGAVGYRGLDYRVGSRRWGGGGGLFVGDSRRKRENSGGILGGFPYRWPDAAVRRTAHMARHTALQRNLFEVISSEASPLPPAPATWKAPGTTVHDAIPRGGVNAEPLGSLGRPRVDRPVPPAPSPKLARAHLPSFRSPRAVLRHTSYRAQTAHDGALGASDRPGIPSKGHGILKR